MLLSLPKAGNNKWGPFSILPIGIAEPQFHFLLFQKFYVGEKQASAEQDKPYSRDGTDEGGNSQIHQNGSQSHRVATIAVRFLDDQLLGCHDGNRGPSADRELNVVRPQSKAEPRCENNAANEDIDRPNRKGRQSKLMVNQGRKVNEAAGENSQEHDACHYEQNGAFSGIVLALCVL